ncbi:hypothetical protein OH77DRAFT_122223 [Trametes cingulata]|nr:hypothetical protein OH77DRAFT_122223 [Trametes cingulata]
MNADGVLVASLPSDLQFYKGEAERQAVEIINLKARIAYLETCLAQEKATTESPQSEAIGQAITCAAIPSNSAQPRSSREVRDATTLQALQTAPLSTGGSSISRQVLPSAESIKEEPVDNLDLLIVSWARRESDEGLTKRSLHTKRKRTAESRECLVNSALAPRPLPKRYTKVSAPPHPPSQAKGKEKEIQMVAKPYRPLRKMFKNVPYILVPAWTTDMLRRYTAMSASPYPPSQAKGKQKEAPIFSLSSISSATSAPPLPSIQAGKQPLFGTTAHEDAPALAQRLAQEHRGLLDACPPPVIPALAPALDGHPVAASSTLDNADELTDRIELQA